MLRFNDRGFKDPFYAQQMSDGTLKVFAYLLLLEDPSPPPFLCIEEPENGLYHKLLDTLASEFRSHATGRIGGSQIFVTTHQPYLVDALDPDEVWLLEKGEDGFARVRRASANKLTTNLVDEGLPLGGTMVQRLSGWRGIGCTSRSWSRTNPEREALDIVVPKLVGVQKTRFNVKSYKGLGRIPEKPRRGKTDPQEADSARPTCRGYCVDMDVHTANYPAGYEAAVIVVCDLDDRCLKAFRGDLIGLLQAVYPRPRTCFCLAIEEGEAWLLGDRHAVLQAYPGARQEILDGYVNDSICGTWEKLADAVYPGGSVALSKKGWQAVGKEKSKWAEDISPGMDVHNNSSPSFQYFRDAIRVLATREKALL